MPSSFLTFLTVDLKKLKKNFLTLQAQTTSTCSSVIKCDAYGLGLKPISKALFQAGCHTFFTSHLDEAIELRKHLGNQPEIFSLLAYQAKDQHLYKNFNITPILNNLPELKEWEKSGCPTTAGIHIDTGINRLGFNPEEIETYNENDLHKRNIKWVMTHLTYGKDIDIPYNQTQIKKFKKICDLYPSLKTSLGGTSACFKKTINPPIDLIRLGIGLYGYGSPHHQSILESTLTLKTTVLQTKWISKGDTVGYDQDYIAPSDRYIATLYGGYYTYPQLFSHRKNTFVMFNKVKLPIIGRISMDLITIDATEVAKKLHPMDTVDILNSAFSLDEFLINQQYAQQNVMTDLSRISKQYID